MIYVIKKPLDYCVNDVTKIFLTISSLVRSFIIFVNTDERFRFYVARALMSYDRDRGARF